MNAETKPQRVLILTAGFGEGHNAAARALAAAFPTAVVDASEDSPYPQCTATIVDAFELASPRFNKAARHFYLTLINRAPRLWSRVYDWIDRSNLVPRRLWLFHREIRLLADVLERERPSAICCTYPLYGFFLEQIARAGGKVPPTFNVVTDSISIHSLWWRAPVTGWFMPNEDSAVVLRDAGINPASIHVCGFPVPAFFADHASRLAPPDLATGAAPRVLQIINSGTRHAEETARRLLTETPWEITCAVGRDSRLQARLLRLAEGRRHPTQILGWTDQIPRLLMTHHAVVSKAGGATTQEAIAALCPMIVSQIVPGQEEGNYELLRRHAAGALAETPEAVMAQLSRAFADRGRVWRQWRVALRPLASPNAASEIARRVIAAISNIRSSPARADFPDEAVPTVPDSSPTSELA
ncbi:MAG TPA: galactosyldiacylglycerol synthase [Opitutus sp.]|nr:galactosyldiacylglycerol synthase [Opitutus sp.]